MHERQHYHELFLSLPYIFFFMSICFFEFFCFFCNFFATTKAYDMLILNLRHSLISLSSKF